MELRGLSSVHTGAKSLENVGLRSAPPDGETVSLTDVDGAAAARAVSPFCIQRRLTRRPLFKSCTPRWPRMNAVRRFIEWMGCKERA